jgi:hypothetical protein
MMVTRIYADERGESHFSEVELPLALNVPAQGIDPIRTSPRIAATHIQFLTAAPAVITGAWHPAPARQFAIVLKGTLIVEVSNGQSRKLEPGAFLFVEDTVGKGHKNHLVNDEEVVLAFVPVADGLMIQNLS